MSETKHMTYHRASYLIVPVAAVVADGLFDVLFITVLTVLLAFFLDWKAGNL